MGVRPADENLLRQFLLGLLPEPECDEIEQELFTNHEFAGTAEAVEDDIVDDYLDGTLSRREKAAAERHFFGAPEHRHKLHFARLLRAHLSEDTRPQPVRWVPRIPHPFYWAASAAIASLLLLSTGLVVYTAKLRHTLDSETAGNHAAQSALQ